MKNQIINHILKIEGGYVNDPSDSGGETNYGITRATARAYGYQGEMINLPRETAFDIYAAQYWDSVRADELLALSPDICAEVVDTAVNMGASRAGKFFQRALNSLSTPIGIDGVIGKNTIASLKAYLSKRDANVLLKALNALQGAFYIELTERRVKDKKFIYGWLKNRVC